MSHKFRFALAWTGICGALAAVFVLYLRPEMAVFLAEQFWACFGS